MVGKATGCGLVIAPDQLGAGAPNYAAEIVNSRHGMYDVLRPFHRLDRLPVDGAPAQSISSTAAQRFHERVDGYRPPGLDHYLDHLSVTEV